MSKFTFPPQIQQLEAANRGDIALINAGTLSLSTSLSTNVGPVTSMTAVSLAVTPLAPGLGILANGGTITFAGPVISTQILDQATSNVTMAAAAPTDPPVLGILANGGTVVVTTVAVTTNVT